MGKIYQGESLTMLFRCRSKCGGCMDLSDAKVSALMRSVDGDVVYRFCNLPEEGTLLLKVRENCIICDLTSEQMSTLSGKYVMEVKVEQSGTAVISISKKFKIYPSVIGAPLTEEEEED